MNTESTTFDSSSYCCRISAYRLELASTKQISTEYSRAHWLQLVLPQMMNTYMTVYNFTENSTESAVSYLTADQRKKSSLYLHSISAQRSSLVLNQSRRKPDCTPTASQNINPTLHGSLRECLPIACCADWPNNENGFGWVSMSNAPPPHTHRERGWGLCVGGGGCIRLYEVEVVMSS